MGKESKGQRRGRGLVFTIGGFSDNASSYSIPYAVSFSLSIFVLGVAQGMNGDVTWEKSR
jgi:hypothetical protein